MIAVTAGDQVTVNPVRDPVLGIGDPGMRCVDVMNGDVGGLIDRGASLPFADFTQVARHLGLAIGGDHLAIGVF